MTGITLLCRFCGRPIVGSPAKYGGSGEPYHLECTLPPAAFGNPTVHVYEAACKALWHWRAEAEALVADKDRRIEELEAALRLCMVGGNHLPLIFGVNHPHAGVPAEAALRVFGPGNKYEAWCCWDAIMRARDILEDN